MAAGGDAIGRLEDGRVVFCEGALPGEKVMASMTEQRRDYGRAAVLEVLEPSPLRVAPPCPHVAAGCGGCSWQHVLPDGQTSLKVGIVADALRRLAHLPDVRIEVAPGGVAVAGYRTSVNLAVDQTGRAVYHRRHGHAVVTVDSCLVTHPLLEELLVTGRFPGARRVGLRVGARTGDRLAAPDRGSARATVPDGTVVDPDGAIREDVGGRRWQVSARSFFQSGPDAAEAILEAVNRAAGDTVAQQARAGGAVVDLYAGVGVLGGCLADRWGAASLTAVESHDVAAADAAVNLADIGARVIVGEVADACREGAVADTPPAVVIADPARSGLGPSATAAVARLGSPVVVLVSCDPASLARDAGLLGDEGYRLDGVEVVDVFPGTFHTETVSRFVLEGSANG